jgi:hypothetical protein
MYWNFDNGRDGAAPEAGLIADKRGDLCGTTAIDRVYNRPGLR